MHNFLRVAEFTFGLLLVTTSTAKASLVAVSNVISPVNLFAGADVVEGWMFTANSSMTVTALGVLDAWGPGLEASHDVGIYRYGDQELLSSVTVPAGTPGFLLDGFRYIELSASLTLDPDTYVILMTAQNNNDVQWVYVQSFYTPSQITWVKVLGTLSPALAFTDRTDLGYHFPGAGIFGPNFIFEDPSVPEPGSAFLVVAGISGLIARRRVARWCGYA